MRQKNRAGDHERPVFKLYYTAVVIKIVRYWDKNRHRSRKQR